MREKLCPTTTNNNQQQQPPTTTNNNNNNNQQRTKMRRFLSTITKAKTKNPGHFTIDEPTAASSQDSQDCVSPLPSPHLLTFTSDVSW